MPAFFVWRESQDFFSELDLLSLLPLSDFDSDFEPPLSLLLLSLEPLSFLLVPPPEPLRA